MNDAFRLSPESASNLAGPFEHLFITLCVITLIITLGIAATIVYYSVRYRRRHPGDIGVATGDHRWMEYTWTVIPLVVFLIIFVWSTVQYVNMSRPPANAMIIQVVGKQWMWKLQHPSGRKEIDELHVPLGIPVKLQMTSQDVIHSFYIPAFRIKQDVVPGRYSEEWFTATKLGEYHLFCAEYCGTSHALMGGRVVVMTPGDYQKWAASGPLDERPEAAGARLFAQYGCISCHGQQAPSLYGIFGHEQVMDDGRRVVADEAYLRESILSPRAKIVAGFPPLMPSYQGQLSEEQIFDLIAYIKSIDTPLPPFPPPPRPLSPEVRP